jgi:hypothetical protein
MLNGSYNHRSLRNYFRTIHLRFDLPEDLALLGCVIYFGATNMPALMKIAASVLGFL